MSIPVRNTAEFKFIKAEVGRQFYSEEQLVLMEEDYFEVKAALDEVLMPLAQVGVPITWYDLMQWIGDFEGLTDHEKMWIMATLTDYIGFIRFRFALKTCGCEPTPNPVCPKCNKMIDIVNYTK